MCSSPLDKINLKGEYDGTDCEKYSYQHKRVIFEHAFKTETEIRLASIHFTKSVCFFIKICTSGILVRHQYKPCSNEDINSEHGNNSQNIIHWQLKLNEIITICCQDIYR